MNNYNEIIAWIEDSFNQVLEGETSALELLFELSELEKSSKAYKDSLRENSIREIGCKKLEINGVRFEKFQTANYKYENCEAWQKQNEILKEIESKCKTVIQLKELGKEIDTDLLLFDGANKNHSIESIKITKLKK